MKKAITFALTAAALVLCAASGSAVSQTFPAKPIRVVVGLPPGGGTDATARLVADHLSKAWGQAVIVENKPGAGGIIATELVARSVPDGYTLLLGSGNTMVVSPAVYTSLTYDPLKDFAPVSLVVQAPLIFAVHPSMPVNSMRELIAHIKANPDKINFSSTNVLTRLANEMFFQATGARMTAIPYKGGAPSVSGVLSGDVPLTIIDGASVLAQMRAGLLRGLAVTTSVRQSSIPELPTVAESGVPGYDIATWFGLFAPAGTPSAIVTRLNGEIARMVALPEVRARLAVVIGGDAKSNTPEQFATDIRNDIVRYRQAAKIANLQPD